MARFISVEIDASQLRVAEIEEVGKKERILQCFSIPMPQGMTEDGEVRDTKNLAELLVQGLETHAIKSKKIYFVAGSCQSPYPASDGEKESDTGTDPDKQQ